MGVGYITLATRIRNISPKRERGQTMPSTVQVPVLIDGRFETAATDRVGEVFNPSTGRVQAHVPYCTAAEIDRAARAAAKAFPAWSETPAVERARVMFRFRE